MRGTAYFVASGLLAGGFAACGETMSGTAGDQDQIVQQIQRELDAAAVSDPSTFNSVRPVRPVLGCVDRLPGNLLKAHFGYTSSSSAPLSIPIGFFNRFSPPPTNRGQPTRFVSGSQADIVQVTFSAFGTSTWVLGSHFAIASRFSRPCALGGTGGNSGAGGSSGAGGAGPCPSTCDDRNPCTIDLCGVETGFSCVNVPLVDGAACSDLNACTTGDTCLAGVCSGAPRICPAVDACHQPATCDPLSGQCIIVARPDGTPCDDNNVCTVGDVCLGGACIQGPPAQTPACAGGDVCGSTVCPSGQVCCNASCGICTPPGDVCIQIDCTPPPPDPGRCVTDGDCRAFSDYCTGCDCRSLAVCQPDPACPGPGVQCLIDPCQRQQAFCDAGHCALRAAPGLCDPAACGPPLGLPNRQCSDGKTVAGPTGRCLRRADDSCGWEITFCPDPGICVRPPL